MAERRMFAKTIIDSDLFLDMPTSTQLLYFHLAMRADDDGFVNSPKRIQRLTGCNDDDMRLLIAKQFILSFESGVIVIKHWRIHNYIRKDRYHPILMPEKNFIELDENYIYQRLTTGRPHYIPLVDLGKDSLGKDSSGKDSSGKDSSGEVSSDEVRSGDVRSGDVSLDPANAEKMLKMYQKICKSYPKATEINKYAIEHANTICEKFSDDDIQKVFEKAERNSFLKGQKKNNKLDWRATFYWLIVPDNFQKIIDGKYDSDEEEEDEYAEFFNDF